MLTPGTLSCAAKLWLSIFVWMLLLPPDAYAQSLFLEPDTSVQLRRILADIKQPASSVNGEKIGNEAVSLSGTLDIVFLSEFNELSGDLKYLAVKAEVAPLLAADPVIESPSDLAFKIVSVESEPALVKFGSVTLSGIRLQCKVEVRPK